MADEDPKKRRYSEEEFALILRKAAEIQESPRDGGTVGGGSFTLEEIQSIAGEAGIDPQAVSRAAALLGPMRGEGRRGRIEAIIGGRAAYHREFEVEGHLPPEEMGRLLQVIRKEAAHQGTAAEVLGGVEWKTVGEVSSLSINITPREGATSIQIVGDRGGAAFVTVLFSLLGPAFASGVLGSILEPTTAAGIVTMVGGLFTGGILVGRTLWVRSSRSFRRKLDRILERLADEVGRKVALPSPGEDETRVLERLTAQGTKSRRTSSAFSAVRWAMRRNSSEPS
jgi:hypothetical protein